MSLILKIAKKYKLKVIEDVAQAHGAEFGGKSVVLLEIWDVLVFIRKI